MVTGEVNKILDILVNADGGNEVVMLESLNNFVRSFPEWSDLVQNRWTKETGKPWKTR